MDIVTWLVAGHLNGHCQDMVESMSSYIVDCSTQCHSTIILEGNNLTLNSPPDRSVTFYFHGPSTTRAYGNLIFPFSESFEGFLIGFTK